MSGYPQGPPMHPGSADQQQMPWMNAMQSGQMQAGQMQGFMDPAMMQAAMAAFQQGQGAAPGSVPQMYFPAMQQQPGVAGMQVPMPVTMSAPATAPAAMPPAAMPVLGQEEQEKAQAIQRMLESLSDVEREYYLFLWQQHCDARPLEGQAAFKFLMRSKLPGPMLKMIWNLADWRKNGRLDWQDFVVTMKLVSAAQRRQAVSLDRVLENCSPNSMDCPEFEGIDTAAVLRGRAAAATAAATQAEGGDIFSAAADFAPASLPEASASKPGLPNLEQMPSVSPVIAADSMPPASAAMPAMDIGDASSSLSAAQAEAAPPAAAPAAAASGGDAITDIMFGMAGSFAEPKAEVAADAEPAMQPPAPGAMAAAPPQPPAPAAAGVPASAWDAFGAQDTGEAPRSVSTSPVSMRANAEGVTLDIADSKSQPPAAEAAWSAFGETPAAAAPAPPAVPGDSEDWGAFGGAEASAPAPAQEWSAFGEPPAAAASMAPAAAPGPEAWDAFGGAPAEASNAKGQGDRWSMISNAFDDLLREDDVKPTASAEGVEEAVEAPAPAQPAALLPEEKGADDWGDFETSSPAAPPGPVAAPLADHFAINFDAPSSSPPAMAAAAAPAASMDFVADFAPAEQSTDSWGDFETSGSAPPAAASTAMPAVPLAADFAADFSQAEESTDAWGDFEAPGSAPPWDDFEAPGSAPPAAVTMQTAPFAADFAADAAEAEKSTDDWGDFEASAPASAKPAAALAADFTADFASAKPAAALPAEFTADFASAEPAAALPSDFTADFAAAAEPSSANSAAPAMPSEIEWPAVESATAAAEPAGEWAAFDAAPMPETTVAAVATAGGSGTGDLFFDDDKAETGPSPGVGASPSASPSDPFASAMNTAGEAPGASAEASWGAFDDDDEGMDFVSATPAPPAPELAGAAPPANAEASAWSAEFTSAAPAWPQASPAAPAEESLPAGAMEPGAQAFSFEDPAPEAPSSASAEPAPALSSASAELPREAPGSEDEEHRSLARGLADLGLYEDALRCQARGDVVRRLSDAEARKKEAMAREDFEGCIAVRNEIQALNTELTSAGDLEAWQRLVDSGERDAGLDTVAERLRQRCQFVESAASRAALCMAIGNFRKVCPPRNPSNSLADLSGLIRRRRRAWQMSRAIDHASSADILLVLQVLLVCLGAMKELLSTCAQSLRQLASADLSQEERQLAVGAVELRDYVRGLCSLRRLNWRFGLSAELFLPNGVGIEGVDAGELSAEEAQRLEEIHKSFTSSLHEAKAAWACVETELAGLQLDLGKWDPNECYEVLGGSSASTASERHSTEPLCVLCLLPAVHIGSEAPVDSAVASALWKKGVWHVQCANFWIRHCSTSKLLKERGISDPFQE